MVIGFGISTVKVKNGYSSIPTVVVVAFPLNIRSGWIKTCTTEYTHPLVTATPVYECHWSLPSSRLDCLTILSPSHVLLLLLYSSHCVSAVWRNIIQNVINFWWDIIDPPFFLFSPLHCYINLPHSSAVFLLGRLCHSLPTTYYECSFWLGLLICWSVFEAYFLSFDLEWGGKKSDIVPLYRVAVPFQPIFQRFARVSPPCS